MDDCDEAFHEDHDVTPVAVIDSSTSGAATSSTDSAATTSFSRKRPAMTAYQAEKIKLKKAELESRDNFRKQLLETLNKIANKL